MPRVLLVNHAYADNTMAGFRTLRLVQGLRGHGYEPVILGGCNEAITSLDRQYEGNKIVLAKNHNLAGIYRSLASRGRRRGVDAGRSGSMVTVRNISFTSLVNRWLMVPDKQISWYGPAVRSARRALKGNPPDIVFATLMPRTNLLVGVKLASVFSVPCVVEFRDLWTDSPYTEYAQPTAVHRWLHAALESRVIAKADRVSAVCRGIADYLTRRYSGSIRNQVALNYNFFDPTEYPEDAPRAGPEGPFVISYVGAMYTSRHPMIFLEGLRRFIDARNLNASQFCFRWLGGAFSVGKVNQHIQRLNLEPYMDVHGVVAHDEAIRVLCGSHLALAIQSPLDAIHVPGKIFEAIGARVPLLFVANPCEATEIVEHVNAGICCSHDPVEVQTALERLWLRCRDGSPWPYNEVERDLCGAAPAASRLAALFDEVLIEKRSRCQRSRTTVGPDHEML